MRGYGRAAAAVQQAGLQESQAETAKGLQEEEEEAEGSGAVLTCAQAAPLALRCLQHQRPQGCQALGVDVRVLQLVVLLPQQEAGVGWL